MSARALVYVRPHVAEMNAVAFAAPRPGEALVETLWSGISRGTERLVFTGRVPESEYERMRAPFQRGDFPFPVAYGYCAVGRVQEGPDDLIGITAFCLHPHQDRFVVPAAALTPLPEGLPARRATLAANMETALNALWDSGAGPGDRIAVVGAGVVGLLASALAAGLPGAQVIVVDPEPARASIVSAFGARHHAAPPAHYDADVVLHASGTASGLAAAIGLAGVEARVVEMSWHGAGTTPTPLGGAFHSRRLALISSQVGMVAPTRRPRWDNARRLRTALDLLRDDRYDLLLTDEVAFADLPAALPALLAPHAPGLATAVRYA